MPLSEVEKQICQVVVRQFITQRGPTTRRSLLRQFKGAVPEALSRLANLTVLKPAPNVSDAFLPWSLAFHFCGDAALLQFGKNSTEVVLRVLRKFNDQDLQREDNEHPEHTPAEIEAEAKKLNALIEPDTIRVGLYLAEEFGVFATIRWDPQQREILSLRIGERIFSIREIDNAWKDHIKQLAVRLESDGATATKESEVGLQSEVPLSASEQATAEATVEASVKAGSMQPAADPPVYISYARDDQRWKDRIASVMNDAGIPVWHSAPDELGKNPELAAQAIRENSRVLVLLLSMRYIDSDEIHRIEFPHIRSLARQRRARIICVILESCPWQSFFALPDVPAAVIPEGGRPLSVGSEEQIGDDLHTLLREVRSALRETDKQPAQPHPEAIPPAQAKQEAKDEIEESIEISSISDAATANDTLGFKPYVDAISRFLLSPDTEPPLTLSIEGEWGCGKSSFMLQLKNAVTGDGLWARLTKSWANAKSPEPSSRDTPSKRISRAWQAIKKKRRISVQFNPWRHDKEDSLWAAFALEFLRQVSRQRRFVRRWWGHARLFWAHYSWKKGWFEMMRAVVLWLVMIVLVVGLPVEVLVNKPKWADTLLRELSERLNNTQKGTNSAGNQGVPSGSEKKPREIGREPADLDPILRILLQIGGSAAYFAVVLTIWLRMKDIVGNPLEINLRKYLRSPDYEDRVTFVEQFHDDFKKIVDAYAGKEKVFVFIDDLDRCEVPKAAELMKAVNLLIADDPRLVFILGMDREKVAAGLAVKYERVLPYLSPENTGTTEDLQWKRRWGLRFGQEFLQKFIQLPFRVPEPNPEKYGDFIRTISAPLSPNALALREIVSEAHNAPSAVGAGQLTQVGAQEQTPPPPPPSPAEVQARRERELLQFGKDSDKVRAVASMFAKTLGRNPRRLIQFFNLFRLQAYIANETGLFDLYADGKRRTALTLEQLGKFVAISLRWPGLLTQFAEDPRLLEKLEGFAINRPLPDWKPTERESRWLSEAQLLALLSYGTEEAGEGFLLSDYSVSSPTIYRLLHICPQRTRPQTNAVGPSSAPA